jgi:arylamine N-acetyltransferase
MGYMIANSFTSRSLSQSVLARVPAESALSPLLQERVLALLGFSATPEPTYENLKRLYFTWGQRVPFDNIRKLIYVRSGAAGALPGRTPDDFFEAWLKHGTGGTCWPSTGALHSLLQSLGYAAERALATVLPQVHGTSSDHAAVRVTMDGAEYLIDSALRCGEPLRLRTDADTGIAHPAWGVQCARRNGQWYIAWRPLHRVRGLTCRIDSFGATEAAYHACYDQTRTEGPFNHKISFRINRDNQVIGLGFGKMVSLEPDGSVQQRLVTHADRVRFLVEEAGISEEMALQLPQDLLP